MIVNLKPDDEGLGQYQLCSCNLGIHSQAVIQWDHPFQRLAIQRTTDGSAPHNGLSRRGCRRASVAK